MMLPLLHHGMLITGLPYSRPDLLDRGGTALRSLARPAADNKLPLTSRKTFAMPRPAPGDRHALRMSA